MSEIKKFLTQVQAFNARWGRGIPSLCDQADMLTGARTLRIRATEIALTVPNGNDRDFLIDVRRIAVRHERRLRQSLNSSPAIGDGS